MPSISSLPLTTYASSTQHKLEHYLASARLTLPDVILPETMLCLIMSAASRWCTPLWGGVAPSSKKK